MERKLRHGDETSCAGIRLDGERLHLTTATGPQQFLWETLGPGDYLLREGAVLHRCFVARRGLERWVWVEGRVYHLQVETAASRPEEHHAGDHEAPMPGQVLKILVQPGDEVRRHQPLVLLEAMKMQVEIVASRPGRVAAVPAHEGEQVRAGAVLVVLEAEAGA